MPFFKEDGVMPGSWTKRGKNSYKLEVCIGTNYKGKPNRYTKTVHCKSDKQADKELALFYAACESGTVAKASTTTIASFSDKWIVEYAEIKCKRSSLAGYKSAIRCQIKPSLGENKIAKITTMHVQEWINDMVRSGLSPKTIRNYFSVFDEMMQTALKWGLIANNPCDLADLPPKEKKETDYYNKKETIALLDCLNAVSDNDLKYKVGIYIALLCGLRKGEILGLDWSDIDFEKSSLTIRQTRMCIHGYGPIEDTPKTLKSQRTVSMPVELITELRKLQIQQKQLRLLAGSKWINSGAVLTNDYGSPLYPQMLARWFVAFLKENNLRHISLHKLRHTHTSILAYLNTDKMQISKRLGHSQLSTTMNIYTHLFEDTDKQIAEQISSQFLVKNGGKIGGKLE